MNLVADAVRVATTIAAAAMPSVTGRRHPPARARTQQRAETAVKPVRRPYPKPRPGKSGGREIDDSQKMNIM